MRKQALALSLGVAALTVGFVAWRYIEAPKASALESDAARLRRCRENADVGCLASFEPAPSLEPEQIAFIYGTIIAPFWAAQTPLATGHQAFSGEALDARAYLLANGKQFNRIAPVQTWQGKPSGAVSQDLLQTFLADYDRTHDDQHPATRMLDADLAGIKRWRSELEAHDIHGLTLDNGPQPQYISWDDLEKNLVTSRDRIRSGKVKVVGAHGVPLQP